MNRKWVCKNPYQGTYKKVLCCCSAGVLRSPTAAEVLSQKFGFNTRSCGVDVGHALIPVDDVLIEWADEIVVMTQHHKHTLQHTFSVTKPIIVLDIPDDFEFRNNRLVAMIEQNYNEKTTEKTNI